MDDAICRAFLLADVFVMLTDGTALVWLLVRRLLHPEDTN